MIEDSLPTYNDTTYNDTIDHFEPEPVDDVYFEDDHDALFWEAYMLFMMEYPMFEFIEGGERKEIELHFI